MLHTNHPISAGIQKVQQIKPGVSRTGKLVYIDLSSVDKDEKRVIESEVQELSWAEAPSRARQMVHAGDILVSTVRPNLNGVAQLTKKYDGAVASSGFCVLRTNPVVLESRYLFHWLCGSAFVANMVKQSTGASYPAVSDRIITDSLIPIPSNVKEQKRLAEIMDKADELCAARIEMLQMCDALKASLVDQVLSSSVNVSINTIGNLLESKTILLHKDGNHGGNYPRSEEFVASDDGGVPFLTAKNLMANGTLSIDDVAYLGNEKASRLTIGWLKNGDVLLAHNATVGPVGVYRGEWDKALIGTSLTCFRPNPKVISTEALYAALSDPFFQLQLRKQMKQTTRNQVPITAQRDLTLRVPIGSAVSRLSMQLEQMQKLRNDAESFLKDAKFMYSSVCDRAFSGEL